MDSPLVTGLIAVVLVVLAWKVFSGIVKTLALLAILAVAAYMVFA